MKTIYTPTTEELRELGFDCDYHPCGLRCFIEKGVAEYTFCDMYYESTPFYPESRQDVETLIRLLTP